MFCADKGPYSLDKKTVRVYNIVDILDYRTCIMKIKKLFLSFWSFVIYFLIIFAVFTFLSMDKLDDYLADYEYYQPTTQVNEVLGYFKELDAESLEALPSSGEKLTGENFKMYLERICDPESLFVYKSSTGDTTLTYDYITNNKKIASLVLERDGVTEKNNFDVYKIADVVWYPMFNYTVTVPEDCTVYLNGKLLEGDGECVDTDDVYADFDGYSASTYKYTIDNLAYITDVKAESESSALITVEEILRDDGADYIVHREMSDDMKAELDARTHEFVPAYMYYTTLNTHHVSTVLPYVHRNAELYTFLKNFNNTWNHSKLSDRFTRFDISNYVYHDETHASCRADVIYEITKWGNNVLEFDFFFDLHYVKVDGVWYLVYMERGIE
jgi:hypothetical protein